MKMVSLEQATLDTCIDDAQHERVVITRNGKPIALIISIEGLGVQQSQPAQIEVSKEDLEERVARLEAEVAALKEALPKPSAPYKRPTFPGGGYSWVELPEHLKGVTDYSQLDPEDLVYVHELTDEDIRLRLEELEQAYGMTSEEFYRLWQQGEADHIFDKTEWSILYEDWFRIKAESAHSDEEME